MTHAHEKRTAVVRIRRDLGRDVRSEAEELEGQTIEVQAAWIMEGSDPYPGEWAWMTPRDCPITWMAEGDLEFTSETEGKAG